MKNLLRWACAIACVLLPSLASAQSVGSSVIFPSGWAPGQSICVKSIVDGTCVPVSSANPLPVTGGTGGGGGGGDPSSTGTVSATTAPATVSMAGLFDGTTVRRAASDTSGRAIVNVFSLPALPTGANVIGSIANTGFGITGNLPAFATPPTFNLGTGGLGASGSPIYTTPAGGSPTTGTPGATAPVSAQQIAGVGPTGNLRVLATDTTGRLLPAQGVPVTVAPIAVAANTITPLSAAAPTRIGMSVQLESASTAMVYLCAAGQSTTCSATVHDAVIPSGAAIGTEYFFAWPSTAAYYVFSTAAVTIAPHSVVSQ